MSLKNKYIESKYSKHLKNIKSVQKSQRFQKHYKQKLLTVIGNCSLCRMDYLIYFTLTQAQIHCKHAFSETIALPTFVKSCALFHLIHRKFYKNFSVFINPLIRFPNKLWTQELCWKYCSVIAIRPLHFIL